MKNYLHYKSLLLKERIEPFLDRVIRQYSDVYIIGKRGHFGSEKTEYFRLKETIKHFEKLKSRRILKTEPVASPGYAEVFERTPKGLEIHIFTNPDETTGNKEILRRIKEYKKFSESMLEELAEKKIYYISDFEKRNSDMQIYF